MKSFKNILLATDLSESAQDAAQLASQVARVDQGQLHLLHVRPPFVDAYGFAGYIPVPDEDLDAQVRERLDKLALELGLPAELCTSRTVLQDPAVAQSVVDFADRIQADLIVVGTHARHGLERLFLGSVAANVTRIAHQPVLVVPAYCAAAAPIRRVMVAIDFSQASRQALCEADAIAQAHGARLLVLHVVDDAELPPYFAEGVRRDVAAIALEHLNGLLKELQLEARAEPLVITGRPHEAIAQTAREHGANLVVMGATGLSALQRLMLGSVTDRVLRSKPGCSVLVHRGPVCAGI